MNCVLDDLWVKLQFSWEDDKLLFFSSGLPQSTKYFHRHNLVIPKVGIIIVYILTQEETNNREVTHSGSLNS